MWSVHCRLCVAARYPPARCSYSPEIQPRRLPVKRVYRHPVLIPEIPGMLPAPVVAADMYPAPVVAADMYPAPAVAAVDTYLVPVVAAVTTMRILRSDSPNSAENVMSLINK